MACMTRPPDNGVSARTENITFRATRAWVGLVDTLRGDLSRSAYLRSLVQKDAAERKRSARSE